MTMSVLRAATQVSTPVEIARARLEVLVGLGQRLGQALQEAAFDRPALGHPRPGAAQDPPMSDLDRPGVVLGLQVLERAEAAQGRKVVSR